MDCFIEMAKKLDSQYQIVLVGTDDKIDKILPENIISIHRTQNQKELAEIYTAADVFAMPTREENFPTVNLEALACGTPVVTFDTGGSSETLDSETGIVVPTNSVKEMIDAIDFVCNNDQYTSNGCRKRSENFNMYDRFSDDVKIYTSVLA